MAAPLTKTKEERMQRRARVSELYLEGRSMAEVGKILGVSHDTVFRDICWCRNEWRTRAADPLRRIKSGALTTRS
jgi:transposase